MLRDEDLLLALSAEMLPAEGAYAPYGRWSVFLGKDINDPQSRMVAIHEQTHGRLNRTTSYGCLLIALGLLARDTKGDRSRHARHQLEALVEGSRFTMRSAPPPSAPGSRAATRTCCLARIPATAAFSPRPARSCPAFPMGASESRPRCTSSPGPACSRVSSVAFSTSGRSAFPRRAPGRRSFRTFASRC